MIPEASHLKIWPAIDRAAHADDDRRQALIADPFQVDVDQPFEFGWLWGLPVDRAERTFGESAKARYAEYATTAPGRFGEKLRERIPPDPEPATPQLPVDPDQKNWSPNQLLGTTVKCLNEHFLLLQSKYNPQASKIILAREPGRVVRPLGPDADLDLQRYLSERYRETGTVLTRRTVAETIFHWKGCADLLTEEPALLAWPSDSGLTFCRLPFAPRAGDWSAWEEFTERCSDPDTFLAYVAACFKPENKSRQALLLRGEGQDGKSTVIRVVFRALGPGAAALDDIGVTHSTRFLLSGLYGKAVIAYPDCKVTDFFMGSIFRAIVSDDPVRVEFKGQGIFSTVFRAKLIAAMNEEPELASNRADQSRLIRIEVGESRRKSDPSWEARLTEQLPAFLHACFEQYAIKCRNEGDIAVSETTRALVRDAAADRESTFDGLIRRHFVFTKGTPHEEEKLSWDKFLKKIEPDFKINVSKNLGALRQWLERAHGIKRQRDDLNGYFLRGLAPHGVVIGGKPVAEKKS
jgi:hypothetical protein